MNETKNDDAQIPSGKSIARFFESDFFSRHATKLLYILVSLLLVLVLLYRIVSSSSANAERDYFNAEAAFSQLQFGMNDGEQPLDSLLEILNRHAELHSKYDGLLVHELLKKRDLSTAKELAQLTFNRVPSNVSSLYQDFSKATFLIYVVYSKYVI